jgi:chemotaxis protein CheD
MYKKQPYMGLEEVENQPVGDKNVAAAATLLMNEGVDILVAHVGEFGYRRVVFDITTGDVWVRFTVARGAKGDVRSLHGRI